MRLPTEPRDIARAKGRGFKMRLDTDTRRLIQVTKISLRLLVLWIAIMLYRYEGFLI